MGLMADMQGQNVWKGMGVGAFVGGIAGMAGFGFSVAGTAMGISGIIPGMLYGAASGALVGSLSGGLTSGLLGTDIGTGFKMGAITGAVTGAAFGGIRGGIRQHRMNGIFRKGVATMGIDPSEALSATDKTLQRAQKAWFPDAPMDKVKDFTTENIEKDILQSLEKRRAAARTIGDQNSILGTYTGRSSVYFHPERAFVSAKQLFYTMGHELIHVNQYARLAGIPVFTGEFHTAFVEVMEYGGYGYEYSLGGSDAPIDQELLRLFCTEYPNIFKTLSWLNYSMPQALPSVWDF